MKRLLTATALLLAGTAAALADPCTVVYSGTNPTYAPDDSVITLLPDLFSAFVGNNGTCAPSFNAHKNEPNDPDVFEVYTSDIRGDTFFPNDEVKITVKTNGRTYTGRGADTDAPSESGFRPFHGERVFVPAERRASAGLPRSLANERPGPPRRRDRPRIVR